MTNRNDIKKLIEEINKTAGDVDKVFNKKETEPKKGSISKLLGSAFGALVAVIVVATLAAPFVYIIFYSATIAIKHAMGN